MALKGIQYLKNKLAEKRTRVNMRYMFYEMKNVARDFGISTPPDLRDFFAVIGWCGKGVDSIADRLRFRDFVNDLYGLNQIYALNNRDVLMPSAFLGALIGSCDFIYVREGSDGFPRLQVIDGGNATGEIDETTGLLTEGYAVLERDYLNLPTREAYFTPEYTAIYEGGRLTITAPNKAPVPCLVPIIYRPDSKRPFGHSAITRACIGLTGSALRTIKRSEISAEFYSFPQKWVTGTDKDMQKLDKWTAAMSAMMKFSLNRDGTNHVQVGQFQQQSMEPHVNQLRMFASLFSGETGLTLDDLGFPSDNPSSAEAIKATHENLRLKVEKAQQCFTVGLLNAGYVAACIRDGFPYERSQLWQTEAVWYPPFAADMSTLGAVGDGLSKLSEYVPGYITEEKVFRLTGI